MSDQQEKEFGFEEEDVFGDDEVFSVEDLDAGDDPVPEFEALAPERDGIAAQAPARTVPEPNDEQVLEPETLAAVPERKSSMTRILVLVLLLVVVAAGLFFFLGNEEPEPVAKLPVPRNKPITVPKPPAEPAVVTEQLKPAAELVQPAPAPQPSPVETAVAVAEPPAVVVAEPPAAASTPAPPVPPAKALPEPPVAKGAPVAEAVATGPYRVQVGAYVLPANLHQAERQLRKLGFEPQVVTDGKILSMTRLLYGRFPAADAARELAGMKKLAPDAFMVHEGDQVDIFVGSYVSLDKARRFADLLYEQQVKVKEVTVEVTVPLYRLIVGPMADHQAAEEVLKRLQQEGLDGQILKRSQEAG